MESYHCLNAISPKFDREWVQVLINLKMKYSKWFTGQRNSASEGWKLIFDELNKIGAPSHITISKLKKKWMNLMTRYKQIKNNTINSEKITWPYFEQINRAFGNHFLVAVKCEEKKLNCEEKQDFIKKLIKFRCEYKHLFTGKKYTAVEGWKIIIKLLDCDKNYTVQQINKCWQNLVQRYKQILKSDTNVFWPYFEDMHKWFLEEGNVDESNNNNNDMMTEDENHFNNKFSCGCKENNAQILALLQEIKTQFEQFNKTIWEIKDIKDSCLELLDKK